MASGPYSFIDIAVMEDVRARFAAGDALAILTIDLDEVIWANGAGAALFGFADIEAVMGASPGLAFAARRQISAAPGFPRTVRNRAVGVRLATGMTSRTLTFHVNSLTLPRGEPAILLAVPANEPGARIIDGFEEAGYFAALLDGDAQITAASDGFAGLDIADTTLAGLVEQVAAERDRLVKRLIPAGNGQIPAGIARLTDNPPLHLLIAIDEVVEAPAEPEDETQSEDEVHEPAAGDTEPEAPLVIEAPEPSDSDLVERVEEDAALDASAHGDDADDWYFGPAELDVTGREEDDEPLDAERIAAERPDYSNTAPIRFVWRTDADGAFSFISDEFVAQVRQTPGNLIGRPFRDVAGELNLDPGNDISNLLDRRDTWSGRTVLWPIAGTDLLAPVDLAALPTYNRERVFEGFRGFGVLRLGEAAIDPKALGVRLGRKKPKKTPSPSPVEVPAMPEDPFKGEVPVISIAEHRDRRLSDKVIRLAEHRTPQQGQLSPGERSAFEEIRVRLTTETAKDDTIEPEVETPDADEATIVAEAPDEGFVTAEAEQETQDVSEDAAPLSAADDAEVSDAEEAEWIQDATEDTNAPIAESGLMEPELPAERDDAGEDFDLIAGLPLPLLVHAGDELYFANREFLNLTGYASLDQIRREGGLDRLFVEQEPGVQSRPDNSKLHLRTLGGEEFPVDAHLQSIRLSDRSALLLSVKRVDDVVAPEPAAAPVVVPVETSVEVEEMERRVEEMRTIIDTATDGVVLINADGTIRNISKPAEALFGFDGAQVEGRPFSSLFAIESQKAAGDYLSGLADNGVASVLNDGREVIGREAEGRFIPLFMTIGRLPDDGGYCAVVRDITQWKRAEEELTQARSQAERSSSQKTEFLARVSHEIRTPLNAIIGFSELMMDEKFGPIGSDRYRDYLRDINRSGNHVLDLVNDLLDISKIEAGEQEMNYEAVSLNDALGESVAMMQPQANRDRVIIRSSLASRLPEVVADLRSVRQIALNLLSNAIRYTQAGGQVIVSTSYEPSGDVVMRVRDTGIGMTLSEIDQALKPFKQINALKRGRHDGTGLGLPLTKAMVEANRARFQIVSTPGEGTLVEISFPSTRVLAD